MIQSKPQSNILDPGGPHDDANVIRPRPKVAKPFCLSEPQDSSDDVGKDSSDIGCQQQHTSRTQSSEEDPANVISRAPTRFRRSVKNGAQYERRAVRRFSSIPADRAHEIQPSFPLGDGQHHRRTSSFRAVERKGDRGKAGDIRARVKAYLRERAAYLRSAGGRNNKNLPHVPDQYYIPPPDAADTSIFDAFRQLFSGAMDDLSVWLYGASFWKILVFSWVLYMVFVLFFVLVLYLVDRTNLNHPNRSGGGCIHSEREVGVLPLRMQLEFAFELSWTTLTTVGYGVSRIFVERGSGIFQLVAN